MNEKFGAILIIAFVIIGIGTCLEQGQPENIRSSQPDSVAAKIPVRFEPEPTHPVYIEIKKCREMAQQHKIEQERLDKLFYDESQKTNSIRGNKLLQIRQRKRRKKTEYHIFKKIRAKGLILDSVTIEEGEQWISTGGYSKEPHIQRRRVDDFELYELWYSKIPNGYIAEAKNKLRWHYKVFGEENGGAIYKKRNKKIFDQLLNWNQDLSMKIDGVVRLECSPPSGYNDDGITIDIIRVTKVYSNPK